MGSHVVFVLTWRCCDESWLLPRLVCVSDRFAFVALPDTNDTLMGLHGFVLWESAINVRAGRHFSFNFSLLGLNDSP